MSLFTKTEGGFRLCFEGRTIIEHSETTPALILGAGAADITMYRGNFTVKDRPKLSFAPAFDRLEGDAAVFVHPELQGEYRLSARTENGFLYLEGRGGEGLNRFELRIARVPAERVAGGGEQFSYLDLSGRVYPIWTREQGVGRNKQTEITRLADASDGGGGDYHTTFYPQASFISSEKYFALLENTEYAELDFTNEGFHAVRVWNAEPCFVFGAGKTYPALLERLTRLLGRQPVLPDWAMEGFWLGVQGGTARALEMRGRCINAGVPLSAVWIQDWQGKRVTSFGKRLQWDWRWSPELYPALDEVIRDDTECRWMGYINPYLVEGGALFAEAAGQGFFVKRPDGSDYLFDFGEFNCGVVDLTNPNAFEWYKNVIKTNLIGLGFRGWMADFGEYLPADAVCFGGTGETLHNRWPVLWARCNRLAVEESGLLGDAVFFMRAGGKGSGGYSTLLWAGDQNVDWSLDDGLPSVITAALSTGLSGFGLHCSDAGGYTTLFSLRRDSELLQRWIEFACFTPVMRSHEGNRPDSNVQLYDSEALLSFTAKMTRMHRRLLPYLRHTVKQNAETGLPVMRPLFFEEDAPAFWERERFSYLLGDDLLVAPVVEPGAVTRTLLLPKGAWIHLWSGEAFGGGEVTVPSPLGEPPVFYKPGTPFEACFCSLKQESGFSAAPAAQ